MSLKQSGRGIFSVLGRFRARSGKPQPLTSGKRSRRFARSLGFESLEGRTVLSASPGASILGTAFNDMTGNGLTADDGRLSAVTINLFRDGGNGTFQGTGLGTDDTLVATKLTDILGKYAFDNLTAGTYFIQEITPPGFLRPAGTSAATKVIVTSANVQGVSGLSIDSFTTNQLVDASSIGVTTAASSIAAPEALGGNRDLFAQLTSAVGEVSLNANAFGQHVLEYNSSATGSGTRIITWDGPTGAPGTLNPTGLNHADLTNAGKSTGILLAIGADHDGGLATIRVYKNATDWSVATAPIPNTGGTTSQPVFIPYSSFTTGGGAGAGAFTDVGAVQLQLGANAAFNGQVGQIGTLGPTQLVNDLANFQPASIGNFVFWDMNKSGIQTGSNPAAANATVQLLQNGSVIATTATNAQGIYQFNNLAPGVYSEKFIAPNNAIFTLQQQGANPALDSDPNASGVTGTFNLASGQNDTTHDAGLVPIDLSITKSVNNPTPTVGTNVTFTITITNAIGYSPATGVTVNDVLPAGLTFVSATAGPGTNYNSGTGVWTVGALAAGASKNLTITANVVTGGTKTNTAIVAAADEPDVGTIHQASASVTPPASIGDFVFWDMNKSGIQTGSNPGVPNVTVGLLQNGSLIATTITNAQGAYQFNDVAPGIYSEKFIAPNNAVFTLQDQGGNDALDSDVNAAGATATFALASGQNDTTRDAGLIPIDLSIAKAVDNPTPNVGTNVTFTITITNAIGYSPATGVTVNDVLPVGLSFVSAMPGSGTSFNSGTGVWNVGALAAGASKNLTITANVVTGGTKTNTAIVAGADEPDVGTIHQASASVTPPASIGDFVFWDLNKSGIQTGSNPAAANVTVQLLQNGSIVGTTTTNAQGSYQFNNLAPGVYSEKFIAPNNAIFTLQQQGTNPALDSDPNASGVTGTFNLASGQNDTTHDAGLIPIDLSIAKAVDNPTPNVGTNVTFTITITNAAGYSPATGVTVNDVLPAGLTFVSATPGGGTSYNSGTGVWNVGALAAGASQNLTITANVVTGGTKTNTAIVAGADEPDVGTIHQASASVTPPGSIGNFVFWDMNKSGIQTGSNPAVANVTVQLLQNGSIVATTTTNAQGTYQFNNLAPGVYSEKFIAPNNAIFTLQDQGNDDALDSDPNASGVTGTFSLASGQNDTTHDAGLVPIDLSIAKAVNNSTPTIGTNVTFTITITNATGFSPATGVTVNDVLPAGLTFVSATPGAGTSYDNGTGVWNVGALASGASKNLAITATVVTAGTKINTAIVTGADEPDVGTVHQASASVTPPELPPPVGDPGTIDLAITKIVNNATPALGSNVTFTIVISNGLNMDTAHHVTVFDALPPGMTYVSSTTSTGTSYSPGSGVWTVNSLANGVSATLTITATVNTAGTKINTATVTGFDEPNIGDVLEASASVTPPPKLSKARFLGR